MIHATTLTVGHASAAPLVLTDALSFWGGVDDEGTIVDRGHRQYGESVAGRVLVLPAGKGSSSSSSVLAELIRNGSGPTGIVLGATDAIIALGALVAEELYDIRTPVVVTNDFAGIPRTGIVQVDAWADRATIGWANSEDAGASAEPGATE
ncbi:aconitase X swivel domain-containing protein [uncultured Microbacterium sp.]|uniref:aconitase X swivel domain-containing protein n=1 Tax=uncultured Microbacterium sp. TaxID=191216 RepID=UPI0035CA0493